MKLTGLAGAGILSGYSAKAGEIEEPENFVSPVDRKQVFNMTNYAAPAVEKLRLGFIGLGKGS